MSGFDANQVYTVSVHDVPAPTAPESASAAEKLLLEFILQFQVDGQFIYRSASLPDILVLVLTPHLKR
jgi:DNA replication licensing factor MCM5